MVAPGDYTLTYACRREDVFVPEEVHVPDRSNWSIVHYADHRIQGHLLSWACLMLLDQLHRGVIRTRDVVSRSDRHTGGLSRLKEVRRFLSVNSLDTEVAVTEIRRLASNQHRAYRLDALSMTLAESRPDGKPQSNTDLLADLSASQKAKCDELADDLHVLVGNLSATSNTVAAITNTKLQIAVVALAAASIGIAVWAVVQTSSNNNPPASPTTTTQVTPSASAPP